MAGASSRRIGKKLIERSKTVSNSPYARGLTVKSFPKASPKHLGEIIMGNLTESELEEKEAAAAAAAAAEEDDGVEFVIPVRGWSFGEVHEIPKRIAGKQTEIIPSTRGELTRKLVEVPHEDLERRMEEEAYGFVRMRKIGGIARKLPPLAEDPEEEVVPVSLVVQPEIGSHLHRPKTIYPPQLYSDIQSDSFEPIIVDRFPVEEVVTNEIPEEEELPDMWNATVGERSGLLGTEGAAVGEAPDTVSPYANVFYRFEDDESGRAWGEVYPDQKIFEPQFADEEEMSRVIEHVPDYPNVTSRSSLRTTRDERAANADAEAAQKAQKSIRHRQQPLFCMKYGKHRDVHGTPCSARIEQTSDAGGAFIAVRAASRPESFLYVTARSQDRVNRMKQGLLEAHAMHEAIGDEVVTRGVSTRCEETPSRTGRRQTTRSEKVVTRQVSTGRGEITSRTGRRSATRSEEEVTKQVSSKRGVSESRMGSRAAPERQISTRREAVVSKTEGRTTSRGKVTTKQQSTTHGEGTLRHLNVKTRKPPWR
ncbi:Hypothetical predicted protein [Octopus vulgaris]|uniref:Uncharacterized protein n=1 Tax=Octopus vulgaris TaxID=6645 RepID=A0AA36BGU2_OCTVU|nr:Hypothetical predicted protein [Octopus vulgaris]